MKIDESFTNLESFDKPIKGNMKVKRDDEGGINKELLFNQIQELLELNGHSVEDYLDSTSSFQESEKDKSTNDNINVTSI